LTALTAIHHHHGHASPVPTPKGTRIPVANWPIAHGAFTITWHEQVVFALFVMALIVMALMSRSSRRRNPRQRGQSGYGY
jgi:hypothetical protein